MFRIQNNQTIVCSFLLLFLGKEGFGFLIWNREIAMDFGLFCTKFMEILCIVHSLDILSEFLSGSNANLEHLTLNLSISQNIQLVTHDDQTREHNEQIVLIDKWN